MLGSLNNPRVTLVANEPMSEKDKLSWLILNRASSGSDSDEAALGAAAGAWLAGNINDKIGWWMISASPASAPAMPKRASCNPAEQVLTVGKQLTNDCIWAMNTASRAPASR